MQRLTFRMSALISLSRNLRKRRLERLTAFLVVFLGNQLAGYKPLYGAEFFCSSGNVTCLIAAVNESNRNGQQNTINLDVGEYTLTTVDNITDGGNGLPSIRGTLTIQGPEGTGSTIERDPGAPLFRLFHVAATGKLKLKWLGLRGGGFFPFTEFCEDVNSLDLCGSGGAIFSRGRLSIFRNAIYNNDAADFADGGAIFSLEGSLTISHSDVRDNQAGESFGGGISSRTGPLLIEDSFIFQNSSDFAGGISVEGKAIIRRTTIFSNTSERGVGGAIFNSGQLAIESSTIDGNVSRGTITGGAGIFNNKDGTLTLVSSTVSRNSVSSTPGPAAGIYNAGTAVILNSTISQNDHLFAGIGGLENDGTAELQNTILAGNASSRFIFGETISHPSDCDSAISLGNNVVGDPTGCNINLQGTDLTGDPGLAGYAEDPSIAGSGRYPLLSDSPAIDSANPDACPRTDQLGLPRVGTCDIGSVEFQGRMLVSIDIRPQSDANNINPNSAKDINVAILSVNGFDGTAIDPHTVRFGATGAEAGPIHVARTDIDGDGNRDMVLRFQIPDTGIQCGDSSAALTGKTFDGISFVGSSSITTVQCKKQDSLIASGLARK